MDREELLKNIIVVDTRSGEAASLHEMTEDEYRVLVKNTTEELHDILENMIHASAEQEEVIFDFIEVSEPQIEPPNPIYVPKHIAHRKWGGRK